MFSVLLLLLQFSYAQVEDASWYTRNVQGSLLGRESRCTPATIAEAAQLDCNISNYQFTGDVTRHPPDQADNLTEEIFFQSLAQRSHRSSTCHNQALSLYERSPAEKTRFNNWALDAFRSIEDELRYYVRLRDDYESELASRRMAIDHKDISEAQWNSRRRMVELQGLIANLNMAISSLTAKIPLGNHKEISDKIVDLVKRDAVADSNFFSTYEGEIRSLNRKIGEATAYFTEHHNPATGLYEVDHDLKVGFAQSRATDIAFASMPEAEAFSDGLQCRVNARYRTGQQLHDLGRTLFLGLLTILAAEVVIPIRAGAAALSISSAAARLTYMGAEFTLLALNGVIAAATVSDIARSCAGPTVLLSGEAAPSDIACRPQDRLVGMIQEASNAECATNILFTAAPVFMELRRGYQIARNIRAAPVETEVETIVVTAQRRETTGRGRPRRERTRTQPRDEGVVDVRPAGRTAGVGGDDGARAARGGGDDAAGGTERRGRGGRQVSRTEERTRFTDEYMERTYATPEQNQRWMDIADETNPGTAVRFFDVENSAMKRLNDSLLDKNFVTALTNMHKETMGEMIEALARRYPGVEFLPYSDFKSMRYAMRPRPPATSLPEGLEEEVARAFRNANETFARNLRRRDLIPDGENPENWFRAGFASTADEATLASRYARNQSGGNRMSRYTDEDLQRNMEDARSRGESARQGLQRDLGDTPLMEPSSVPGRMIPRREVFEAARKTYSPEEMQQYILRTTGQEVTLEQAVELRRYAGLVDEFSPGIHVATREVASLADSPAGGFSIDFAGLGAFNGQATADALASASDIQTALRGARAAERRVTAMFEYRKTQVQSIVSRVLNRNGIEADFVASGDDMVVRPRTPIPPDVRQEIAEEMAREIDPASVRMSHVGGDISSGTERMLMATIGEACEKWIRRAASGLIAAQTLNQTLMLVEVSGASSANFTTNLVVGEGSIPLSDADRSTLDRLSGDAARAGCR